MTDGVREFLRLHLSALGGVVEDEAGGLVALLPPDAAASLGMGEEIRLAVEGPPQEGAVDARLGSSLLERAITARRARPALAAVAVAGELPRPIPDDLPVLLNAVRTGPLGPRERVPSRYLLATLRATLQGDELRHAILDVAARLADGARVSRIDLRAGYPVTAAALSASERSAVGRVLRDAARRAAPTVFAGALQAIARRARRDLLRIGDYYSSLDAEMARAIKRVRSADERARRAAKRALLPEEMRARRAQLRDRLGARISAELVSATIVETEIDRWAVPVRRRTSETTIAIGRRASDGVLEGPPCAGCCAATIRLYLCDERLHVLCDDCGQPGRLDPARCPGCRPRPPVPIGLSVDDPTADVALGESAQGEASHAPTGRA